MSKHCRFQFNHKNVHSPGQIKCHCVFLKLFYKTLSPVVEVCIVILRYFFLYLKASIWHSAYIDLHSKSVIRFIKPRSDNKRKWYKMILEWYFMMKSEGKFPLRLMNGISRTYFCIEYAIQLLFLLCYRIFHGMKGTNLYQLVNQKKCRFSNKSQQFLSIFSKRDDNFYHNYYDTYLTCEQNIEMSMGILSSI